MPKILAALISIIAIIVVFLVVSLVSFRLVNALILTIVILLLAGIAYLATQDSRKRGFSEIQVFLLRVALVIFFPVSLIIYLIFRPAVKASGST
jgi:hypothetical protein